MEWIGKGMPPQFDKKKTQKNIRLVLDRIKTEADPHLLNEYRSLFKKEVSLLRRSWTAAYLLMLYDQGLAGRADKGRFEKDRSRKSGASGRPDKPGRFSERKAPVNTGRENRDRDRDDPSRYPLAEEESRRLFMSIGRNRRVFPREILGLINAKTAIPREDIGAIRILDNYSFVQVRDTVADTIIEALNGQPFRGRPLAVNYARPREEGGRGLARMDAEDEAYPETAADRDEPEGEVYPETAIDRDGPEGEFYPETAIDRDEPDDEVYPETTADQDGPEDEPEEGELPEQGEDQPDKEDI